MSELTYKKITDVEQVEALNDGATVFVNDNGALKQVASTEIVADVVKTVNGATPDENGNIEINRSNPVPFNKNGNTVQCILPFAEAVKIINKGTNQATVTLSYTSMDTNTMSIVTETRYACRVVMGVTLSTSEVLWIQVDFAMNDGSIVRYQFNPDGTVVEVAHENLLTESAANTLVDTKVAELAATVDTKLAELAAQELTLPMSNGTPNHGTAGQFAVSDGIGGIMWKTLVEAEEVAY